MIGAPTAIGFAWWRARNAQRQADLKEDADNIDRFQKGAQMLDSTGLSVRQAGVITLNDLAKAQLKKFPEKQDGLALMCAQTLERFVVERIRETRERWEPEDNKVFDLPNDAKFALTHLPEIRQGLKSQIDFCRADLSGADLGSTNLIYADLSDADLSDADLRGAFYAEDITPKGLPDDIMQKLRVIKT